MAQPASESRHYTYADYCSWLDDDGWELIDGKVDDAVETVVQPDMTLICDPSKLDDKGCRGAPDGTSKCFPQPLQPRTRFKSVISTSAMGYWSTGWSTRPTASCSSIGSWLTATVNRIFASPPAGALRQRCRI